MHPDLHRPCDRLVGGDSRRLRYEVTEHEADRAEDAGSETHVGEVPADLLPLVDQDADHQDGQMTAELIRTGRSIRAANGGLR